MLFDVCGFSLVFGPQVHKVFLAAASTWDALPRSVRSSTSVLQFRSRLKTELFARSYQQSN